MMASDTRLVYSTDPALNRKCPKCGEVLSECTCEPEQDPNSHKFVAKIRIEKAGRSGKTVTVIDDLPKNELFLKELTTFLKKRCGSGGTHDTSGKEGRIEIQGDRRERIRPLLAQRGIKFKG